MINGKLCKKFFFVILQKLLLWKKYILEYTDHIYCKKSGTHNLNKRYYWVKIKSYYEVYNKGCKPCQKYRRLLEFLQ